MTARRNQANPRVTDQNQPAETLKAERLRELDSAYRHHVRNLQRLFLKLKSRQRVKPGPKEQ